MNAESRVKDAEDVGGSILLQNVLQTGGLFTAITRLALTGWDMWD